MARKTDSSSQTAVKGPVNFSIRHISIPDIEFTDPKQTQLVYVTGNSLSIERVVAVARYGAKIQISEEAIAKMNRSRETVEKIVLSGKPTYGINTGFGEFSKISINDDDINTLQKNLILSHCTAVGEPYSEEVVRAMILLRINNLCIGFSGIRAEVVLTLADMLNKGVHPVIPQKGSLGASGDLAPLAHMVLPLIGCGEAYYQGQKLPGGEAMKAAGITPCQLCAKEGLALINGTQAMTAVGTLAFYDTLTAARMADIACSMTMEALTALTNAFDERVQAVRGHHGQLCVAKNIRMMTQGSEILADSQELRVQDAYAIRCVPQVHGAIRDTLDYVRSLIEIELNSVTDNPLVFTEDSAVISGGNFHGEPMAFAFDFLGIAAAELANISERRLERMLNPALSEGLPPFLTTKGGLNSGYMICQYCAASMVSENKILAHPASVDSIPSSANQEDHVSMGTTAARKSAQIVQNTLSVIAFELMAAAQGIDLRKQKPSPANQIVYDIIRAQVATLQEDREIRIDVEKMNKLVRDSIFIDRLTAVLPEFV